MVNALFSLVGRIIKWPSRQSTQDIINDFKNIKGFPDVIWALDGTHIRITPPSHHPEQYINRKGFSSIQLQCVCDAKLFSHTCTWGGLEAYMMREFSGTRTCGKMDQIGAKGGTSFTTGVGTCSISTGRHVEQRTKQL